MAITVTCPRCTHQQMIADDKAGKEVPCKICHHGIKVPGAKNQTKAAGKVEGAGASTQVQSKTRPATMEEKQPEGIQAGAPPLPSGKSTAPKQTPLTEDLEERPKSRSKTGNEESTDRKRPSARKRPPKDATSSGMLYVFLGGGGLLLLGLVCAGGMGGFFFLRKGLQAEVMEEANEVIVQHQEIPPQIVLPPELQPFINPQPPNPPPEVLDPADPKQIDRVIALLQGPVQNQGPAMSWLQKADSNHPRRSDIAKLLEKMLDEQLKQPFSNDSFYPAYFRWASKENSPSLIRLVENNAFNPWDNQRRQQAMQMLGKLKIVNGADAIAKRLTDAFDRQAAAEALRELGPGAQNAMLKYFHHPDGNARDLARRVLDSYKLPVMAITAQSMVDLESAEEGRRRSALQWIAQTPVDPQLQAAMARLLNKHLDAENGLRNQDLSRALEIWGTEENTPKLLRFLNDPDENSRTAARKILQLRNASMEALVPQAMTDLESLDDGRRRQALNWFATTPMADIKRQREVSKLLNRNIQNEGSLQNGDLVRALEIWGTSENVPPLVSILEQARLGRGDVVRILGKIRDPEGLKAVARRSSNFFDRGEVERALKECGKVAEMPLIEVMRTTKDANVRNECAHLLGEIGTKGVSVAALRALMQQSQQDRNFLNIANAALSAIQQREK